MAKIQITLEGYRCERCGHEWIPRTKECPVICPRCKSPYWDRKKTDRSEVARKAWVTRRKKQKVKGTRNGTKPSHENKAQNS